MLAALQAHDMVAAFSDLASFIEEPERGVIAALEGLGWKLVPIEAEAAAIPAQDSRLDVERDRPDHPYPHHGYYCAERDCPGYVNRPENRPEILQAIKDGLALPSPAPEPPPRLLHADSPHDDCSEEGHHWHVGAAQPAPDPEAIRLLTELVKDARAYGAALRADWSDFDGRDARNTLNAITEKAAAFLSKSEARESGGKP